MSLHQDRILYEDDHLLGVDKLSNELVVKAPGKQQKKALFDFLKEEYPDLYVLHRLDFETSGVVLFAKTKEAHDAVVESKHKNWKKVYRTLVMGRINRDKGVIRFPLPARGENPKYEARLPAGKAGNTKQIQNTKSRNPKLIEAVSTYKVLERFANSSYVEVEIETGRHHQIRRHFEKIGHPLVLDQVYGHKKFNGIFTQEFGYRKFFLHASRLEVPHPVTGEKVIVEARLPKNFQAVIKKLQSCK